MAHHAMNELRGRDELPDSYDRWRHSRLGQTTDRIEEDLIYGLAGPVAGLDVLDLGCGDGKLTYRLQNQGGQVTGLMRTHGLLALARGRAAVESRACQPSWQAVPSHSRFRKRCSIGSWL